MSKEGGTWSAIRVFLDKRRWLGSGAWELSSTIWKTHVGKGSELFGVDRWRNYMVAGFSLIEENSFLTMEWAALWASDQVFIMGQNRPCLASVRICLREGRLTNPSAGLGQGHDMQSACWEYLWGECLFFFLRLHCCRFYISYNSPISNARFIQWFSVTLPSCTTTTIHQFYNISTPIRSHGGSRFN